MDRRTKLNQATNETGNHSGALSRIQAAQYLGITSRFLDKLAAAGKLPKVRIGDKRVVYRVVDLESYLEKNLHHATATATN